MPGLSEALEKARVCREQAALTTNRETRQVLLSLARDIDEEVRRSGLNEFAGGLEQSPGTANRLAG